MENYLERKKIFLKKEPYLLYHESPNKNIRHRDSSLYASLLQKDQDKLIEEGQKEEAFGFESLYDVGEEYKYNQVSKELDIFVKYGPSGKAFYQGEKLLCFAALDFLGWRKYKIHFVLDIIGAAFALPIPILLKHFIIWLDDDKQEEVRGYILASLLILTFVLSNLFNLSTISYRFHSMAKCVAMTQVSLILTLFH